MTQEEFDQLPAETRERIERLEAVAREIAIDLGPSHAADLLETVARNVRAIRIVS